MGWCEKWARTERRDGLCTTKMADWPMDNTITRTIRFDEGHGWGSRDGSGSEGMSGLWTGKRRRKCAGVGANKVKAATEG